MAQKQSYIITTSEDVNVKEVADDKVGGIINGASVQDAVTVMATSYVPEEKDILTSEEFNIITASLTEAEAKQLVKETGIKDVELDEEVFASDDDLLLDADVESDSAQSFFESSYQFDENYLDDELGEELAQPQEDYSDKELQRMAELELQRETDLDDLIDFDIDGQIIMVGNQLDEIAGGLSKVQNISATAARELIVALARELEPELRADVSPDELEEKIDQVVTGLRTDQRQAAVRARDYMGYGLRLIFAPYAWRYTKGANARVAILDTGISKKQRDLKVYGGVSFVPGVRSWNDDQGHGTHVAGIVAALGNNRGVIGTAPQAQLYAVKVLNNRGSGRISWIINGLMACYRARMHVCNLSLGSPANSHNPNQYSRAYERAGRKLLSRGILPVAAAGNSGRTSKPFVGNPARCPSFLAVSAVDKNCRRPSFSSYGPQVDLAAPGVGIWSTDKNGGYSKKSGTSMACPFVAGTAALNKSRRPGLSGAAIRNRMNATATDLGQPGRDPFYGFGLVNAYRSVR